jgi:hypothetical protein
MVPSQEPRPTSSLEFAAFYVKSKGRRETLRFFPKCAGCGKVIFDVAKANVAVVDNNGGALGRPRREGHSTLREIGPAALYCWDCDRELDGPRVPWMNALGVFRGLDEPQRYPEAEYVGKPR